MFNIKDNTKEEAPRRYGSNMCPTHGTKLQSTYYEDLDLLLFKCRNKYCEDGHIIVEKFQERKEKKRQVWLKKNVQKIVDNDLAGVAGELPETQTQQ
jgi:hypothetical protein